MGPCRDCGQWQCRCGMKIRKWLRYAIAENTRQKDDAISEHRHLAAKHDPDFQQFMRKVTT